MLLHLLVLYLVSRGTMVQGASNEFTITAEPGYVGLRQCGKDCLMADGDTWVAKAIGCNYPLMNDCFCRVDFASGISAHATSCLERYCTDAGDPQRDIASYLQLYNSYCLQNGFTLEGAATSRPTADNGGGAGGTLTMGDGSSPTITRVVLSTVTDKSGSISVITSSLAGKSVLAVALALAAIPMLGSI
jgi:hypothetical protein